MDRLNKYFSIDQAIGKEITENEFQCLMADKRIFCTVARFNSLYEAHAAIGGDIDTYNADSHHVHCGHLVTSVSEDLEEAKRIAKQRGWGEEVEGVLYGKIPYDHKMINPCEIKNLN